MIMEYQLGNSEQGKVYLDGLMEILRATPPEPNIENAIAALAIPEAASMSDQEIPEELKAAEVVEELKAAEVAAENILSSPTATPFLVLLARMGLEAIAKVY
jgi:hypothetical protein